MAPSFRHNSWRNLVLTCLTLLYCIYVTYECDQTFVSRPGGPQNGTFSAPNLPNPSGHSHQCIYVFVAGPKQRVEIVFTHFNLRGTPPDGSAMGVLPACVHEYMDVYSEVQRPDPAELVNSPFGGRYCGHIPPRRRISLYRSIALGFYTDKNITTPELFSGIYNFINDCFSNSRINGDPTLLWRVRHHRKTNSNKVPRLSKTLESVCIVQWDACELCGTEYEIGTPVANSPCNFVVHSTQKRTGVLLSPTYPGSYPKDLSCSYQFLGQPNQRVRVEFRDFDLFFGGPHCPFDYVKVFDGPNNESAVIGTYCGQQRNLVLYSSDHFMFVSFVTIQRTANTQNRGFKGIFEFSESFVKLDFIKEGGEHIRGSECDQKILSKKESSGHVYSPNYPFPYIPKIVCRYFIYGMQDSQHLERVRLEFFKFEIPKGEKGDCSDGYLKLYLKGQEATDSYDKFDHEMCGAESNPSVMTSDGPRLVMVFSSGELQGGGFKAKYSFETEYRIPGTAAPDGSCSFMYSSTSRKKGEFNSPRYPSNYPSETNCTYLFVATPNEQVTIVFDHFKIRADGANSTVGSYGTDNCVEDWLEIYQMYRFSEKLVGRYCGMTAPGPIESNRGATGIKVILHTDHEGVYSGFKARYTFETAKSIFGDCGSNVSNSEYGVISSPNFPLNYEGPGRGLASKTCNWFIGVKPKHKIVLYFDKFAVEGDPSARGCPAAVVRVWKSNDGLPLELCGEKSADDRWEYMSESNTMRISFISADKSAGAQGFNAVWTEVTKDTECSEFLCSESSLCIADKLRCNTVANCGAKDSSDELNCVVEAPVDAFLFLCVTLSAGLLAVFALCFWCHRKRRRRRRHLSQMRRRGPDSISHLGSSRRQLSSAPGSLRHVCDEAGERFSSVDSV